MTVAGVGFGESQEFCVGHTDFEMPFGNLSCNIGLGHSGERLQLEV